MYGESLRNIVIKTRRNKAARPKSAQCGIPKTCFTKEEPHIPLPRRGVSRASG